MPQIIQPVFRLLAASMSTLRRDGGVTMAEYALVVTVIALVVIGAAVVLGANTAGELNMTAGKV
jgi:Flp pilus assembly pilin Flp